jgi:predicted RNase H-like HicB family nuclease
LKGCSAYGETEEESLREVKITMNLWLETAKEDQRSFLEPFKKEISKYY